MPASVPASVNKRHRYGSTSAPLRCSTYGDTRAIALKSDNRVTARSTRAEGERAATASGRATTALEDLTTRLRRTVPKMNPDRASITLSSDAIGDPAAFVVGE